MAHPRFTDAEIREVKLTDKQQERCKKIAKKLKLPLGMIIFSHKMAKAHNGGTLRMSKRTSAWNG